MKLAGALIVLALCAPARAEDAGLAAFREAATPLIADIGTLRTDIEALRGRVERDVSILFPADRSDPLAPLRARRSALRERRTALEADARAQAGKDRNLDHDFGLTEWHLDERIPQALEGMWRLRAFRSRYSELFRGLDSLSGRTAALEADVRERRGRGELGEADRLAFAGRLRELGEAGAGLWPSYREMTLEVDRLETAGDQPNAPFVAFRDRYREAVNPAAAGLASLRDRLQALRASLGLEIAVRRGGFEGVGVRDLAELPRLPRLGDEARALNGPLGWAVHEGVGTAVSWLSPGTVMRRQDGAEREAAGRLRLARWTGEAGTVGNPVGAAAVLHRQTGGTCGIVTQQQIIQLAGAAPEGLRGRAFEERLVERAYEAGYFGSPGRARARLVDGTPSGHIGSLLTEHGIPYRRHREVSQAVIDETLRDGRMLIAAVHAPELWTNGRRVEEFHAPEEAIRAGTDHVVVITGGAVDARGRFTVYYINDSGTGEAGRPVSPAVLFSAMRRGGSAYLEIR
ncbi:MAG TPA: hypothetical protein VNI01_01705 [Elusimicrobiota bacterium]|jgi:hypothetical protein|nr:hypothetical protein [Elusimicrobiota bacterium]